MKGMTIRANYLSMLLFGIIFFQLNMFYLVDQSQLPIKFQDIAIFLEVVFFLTVYLKVDTKVDYTYKNLGKWLFIVPIVLGCTSSMMGYIRYNQPFFMGVRAQRAWIAAMLMYYPLSTAIRTGRYSIEKLLNLIDKINIVYFLLIFAQYIVGNRYLFLHITTNQRYGTIRLYVSISFLLISYALHLWKALSNKHIRVGDCFFIVSTLFTYLFIVKSRMGMIALMGATIIVLLKQKFTKKNFVIILLACVALFVFFNSEAGSEIVKLAFESEITSTENDTALIRDVGRTFYISEVKSSLKTFIFGCGYINTDWKQTVRATRTDENIFAVDNGLYGLVFMYGMIFLCWVVVLYFRYIKNAFKNKNDFGVCIFIVGILGSYSLYPECYRICIAFPLTCVIFEDMCYRKKQKKIETQKEL